MIKQSKGGPKMDKKQTLAQFPELACSELHHISGGDWWTDILNGFFLKKQTRAEAPNNHKLG